MSDLSNPLWDGLIGARAGDTRVFLRLAGGESRTFAETAAAGLRAAGALAELGVRPGDRVAAQIEKSEQALALYLGCLAAGAVFLPLNTAYTPSEVGYFLGDAEPALLICDPRRRDALEPVAAGARAPIETLAADASGSFDARARAATPAAVAPRAPDDLAAILYTSGTTGRSKGAMLSHRNLASNAAALASEWAFGPEDVLLHALPIFHTHGLFVATNVALLSGAALIFLPRFDLDQVLAALPRATTMMGVPTFYTRLLEDPRFDRALVAHMRLFVSGSAPLLAETHRAFEARTGQRILERYGMTETNMITTNPYLGERRPGAVGRPLPGVELRIADPETGAALGLGEIGEIEVRGENVFRGYWRMPEKTAEDMRPDGFFRTGDLGRIEADGYLSIVGRAKDLVISGGLNVYPKEVETAIDEIEGVAESAVIGVPHPDFGEAVVAVVTLEPGAMLDEAGVVAHVSETLAAFKRPKRVVFVAELPRNTMGKVQKKGLREAYGDLFARR